MSFIIDCFCFFMGWCFAGIVWYIPLSILSVLVVYAKTAGDGDYCKEPKHKK